MWQQIIWNEEPGGNVEHIEEHGLTVDDVEYVLANPESEAVDAILTRIDYGVYG